MRSWCPVGAGSGCWPGAGSVVAHAAAVLVKRLVRRRRPHHPAIAVNVGTPSQLSFPSAHATSTTAAAILMGRAAGLRSVVAAPAALVPPMALSRILLGVHYPSDVAVGVALGAVIAALAVSLDGRMPDQDVRRRGGAQPAAGPNTAPNTRGAAG